MKIVVVNNKIMRSLNFGSVSPLSIPWAFGPECACQSVCTCRTARERGSGTLCRRRTGPLYCPPTRKAPPLSHPTTAAALNPAHHLKPRAPPRSSCCEDRSVPRCRRSIHMAQYPQPAHKRPSLPQSSIHEALHGPNGKTHRAPLGWQQRSAGRGRGRGRARSHAITPGTPSHDGVDGVPPLSAAGPSGLAACWCRHRPTLFCLWRGQQAWRGVIGAV